MEIKRYNKRFLSLLERFGKWIALCSFAVLVLLQGMNVALNHNQYVNPTFLIFVSLLGWLLTFYVADIISKIDIIKKPMIILGQNTLVIVILHFLCFKIINLAGVLIFRMPKYCIAAFPVLFYEGITWILYSLIGVILPVICKLGIRKMVNYTKKVYIKRFFEWTES